MYSWGSPKDVKEILLNGKRAFVRGNLWSALRQLRLMSSPRTLWIDALCINQNDVQERNHKMHQIYSRAKNALVWLGLKGNNGSIALAFITEAGKEDSSDGSFTDYIYTASPLQIYALVAYFIGRIGEDSGSFKRLDSLRRPEYCGHSSTDWNTISRFFL